MTRAPAAVLRPRALLAGAMAAGSGFGVLGCWWLSREWPVAVPGWSDYRAAVVGDGVLVPLLVGAVLDAGDQLPEAARERRHAVVTGAVGFTLGALLQASWLADDRPQLNWNMLEAHTFNGPGWYHAAFLSTASGVIGALAGRLLARLRSADVMPHASLIFYAGFGFTLLQSLDVLLPAGPAVRNLSSGSVASAVLAVGGAAVAAVLLRPRGPAHDLREHVLHCLAGAGGAALLAVSCLHWPAMPALRLAEAAAIGVVLAVGLRARVDRAVTGQP